VYGVKDVTAFDRIE